MNKIIVNTLRLSVCAAFMLQLTGCGTLMYPERRGQRGGRLDVGVTVLDGIGLLFFVIPGIIAFCVDFGNGTIYLPEHRMMTSLNIKDFRQVRFDPKHTNMAAIERIIKDETGQEVKLDQDNIKVAKLKSVNEMLVQFAKIMPINNNDRLALNN
jgi:hypothetical protein